MEAASSYSKTTAFELTRQACRSAKVCICSRLARDSEDTVKTPAKRSGITCVSGAGFRDARTVTLLLPRTGQSACRFQQNQHHHIHKFPGWHDTQLNIPSRLYCCL